MPEQKAHWQLFRTDVSKSLKNNTSITIPTQPKFPWPEATENAILNMLDRKSREYRSLANSAAPIKSTSTTSTNHKKKFGNFMGNLLLQNSSKVNKPSPIVQREKELKQQILTEEPLAALFRMRKNRNEKLASSGDKGKQSNRVIAFSLRPISLPKEKQGTRMVQSRTSIDEVLVEPEKSDMDEHSEHLDTTLESEDVVIFDQREKFSQLDTDSNLKMATDETNSDNESFVDSLQSDDDVLGPWLELGMINPSELNQFENSGTLVQKVIEECRDCVDITSTRKPLELVTVCPSCIAKWKSLSVNVIDKIQSNFKKVHLKRKFTERKKKVRFDDKVTFAEYEKIEKAVSSVPKGALNTNKKLINKVKKRTKVVKAVIPPTKSHHSLKTNRKMASKSTTNVTIEEAPQKTELNSHFTTGAFMTRKTAKVLADPCNGFYPNPYGFAYLKNVEVLNINGHWYRGSLQMMDKGKVKVRYSDWDEQEEWIIMGSRRLRLLSSEDADTIDKSENSSVDNYIDIERIEDKELGKSFEDVTTTESLPHGEVNPACLLTSGTTSKQPQDYVSSTLDKDPTQIFNNSEVFMTRSMARGLVDEYGFKPNSFGYRRNRAVAITFYCKISGNRKSKQESVGYLREMNGDQVRVWYPDLHQSEWFPVGSRRLRVLTATEEDNVSARIQVDLATLETPDNNLPEATVGVKDISSSFASTKKTSSKKNVKTVESKSISAGKKTRQLKSATDTVAEETEVAHITTQTNSPPSVIFPSVQEHSNEPTVENNSTFLTTGAFATRTAMRQLKDESGFTPNPYGYVNNLAVEVLNTRSGKTKFWECGRLVAMRPGQVKVHYEGWADIYDEWIMVGSRRIRIVEGSSTDTSTTISSSEGDGTGFQNCQSPFSSELNNLLVAETNPEINDEVKKTRKLVRPQDYQVLGMLEDLEELAIKEAQKKERRSRVKALNKSTSNILPVNNSPGLSSEDEDNNKLEYSPATSVTSRPKKLSRKKSVANTTRKNSSHPASSAQSRPLCSPQPTLPPEVKPKQIFSLRLAHVHASKNYQFVANVYGYDYMQHVTVIHADKKVYEGRLVSMHKNKVRVHYCGWLDKFDEYIALGSRRLQPIECDHEVECIEPNYRERYEQLLLDQSLQTESCNTEVERTAPQELINRFSRRRLTLEDVESLEENNGVEGEYHKELPAGDEEIVETETWKVYCNQCNIVIKQFRYYCTYCENPSLGHDYESFELCLRCFDQNFPFWHDHPRSSFAVQAVIDTEIGPRPIKGELVTVWEEDILESTNIIESSEQTNDENQYDSAKPTIEAQANNSEPSNSSAECQSIPSDVSIIENNAATTLFDNETTHKAIDASKVFTGDAAISADQGYKYLKRWRRRKVCAFCNDDDDTSEELGQFIGPFVIATFNKNGVEKKRSFWAHDSCARYSPEVFCTPEGKWYNVTLALRRGRGMRCHGCKEKGATIGCFESKCNKSYHLPCSQKPVSYFKSGVIFWCGVHEAYYDKKDTYVNIFNCDGCNKQLLEESWFTCVPCASSYFSSFDLCSECYEKFPQDHPHDEEEFEETSFAILKEMEAQKAREAAQAKEEIRATNARKKKKPLFPRRKKKLADGSTPVSCCYCGTYETEFWRKGYDGGVIMCNPCYELALFIDNDGKPAEESMPLVIDNSITSTDQNQQQHRYVAPIEDYSHKPYLTRDTLSANKFSEASTGSRLATYEPQPNQLFSLSFDSTYFDIPGRAPRWATHSGTDYHGTWLPQTVRRAILKYTSKDERVLSNFLGRGTDAIECFLLQRRCCGVDINPAAVSLSQRNCCFEIPPGLTSAEYRPIIAQADSRKLSGALFGDESFHHILSHPPYKDCVAYSTHLDGDLSRYTSVEEFKLEYTKVVQESWRLLKCGRRLTLGIGDNREHCFYIPVGFHLMRLYIDQGFELEELVIKRQRYCSAFGLGTYLCVQFDFLVFTHEFIATFKKVPTESSDRMILNYTESGSHNIIQTKRTTRGVPSSAIMRKSVVMGTVWVFKPTETHAFDKLCVSRMVERFGKDDGNWEFVELQDLQEHHPEDLFAACFNSAEPSNQPLTQVIGDMDENSLSEYEQERLKRINENNKTLLKLGLISELSEESEDVIHYETMMSKDCYENGDLVLMITSHISDLPLSKIEDYRRCIVCLARESTEKLAPKGMFIVGTQDIRDPYTGKLYPMTMLVLEDIEREVGRDIIKLKEMVVTVPDGYSKDRKMDIQTINEEDVEESFIDIETVSHEYVPIVHAIYLIFQKF